MDGSLPAFVLSAAFLFAAMLSNKYWNKLGLTMVSPPWFNITVCMDNLIVLTMYYGN